MTRTPDTIVTIDAVTKQFDDGTVALNDFSLNLQSEDFLTLLGPSGCGKSTVLRLLAGLEAPTAGKIVWHDDDRPSLSMVLQDATLLPWANVERNVWMPLRMKGQSLTAAQPAIDSALALVGLEDAAHKLPSTLSGGMKMRVSLARALVTKPSVLLLDEPFAALDEITRFRLNDELLALRETLQCTIVFVTHSVFESAYLANRVAVMDDVSGKITQEIDIKRPYPRDASYRSTTAYASDCAAISAALKEASQVETL